MFGASEEESEYETQGMTLDFNSLMNDMEGEESQEITAACATLNEEADGHDGHDHDGHDGHDHGNATLNEEADGHDGHDHDDHDGHDHGHDNVVSTAASSVLASSTAVIAVLFGTTAHFATHF